MVATGSVLKDSLLLSLPKELCWRLCEPSDSSTGCQMRYVRSVNQHRDDPTHFFGAMLRHLPRTCSGVVCREKDLSLYSQAFWDFTQSEIPEGLSEDEVSFNLLTRPRVCVLCRCRELQERSGPSSLLNFSSFPQLFPPPPPPPPPSLSSS